MINVSNWAERVSHYEDYWNMRNKRPVLHITAMKDGGSYDYPSPSYDEAWFDPEWNIKANRFYNENTYFGGDSYPHVTPSLGPDIISGILGLTINYNEASSWVKHLDCELSEITNFSYKSDNYYLNKMDDFMNGYAEDAKNGDYIVGMVDLNSLLDGVASLVGPANVCYEMMDNPEEVTRVQNEHVKLYKELYDRYNAIATRYQGGNTNWLSIYSPVPWYYITNDFMVMISPKQFDEFVREPLTDVGAYFGRSMFHLDGENAVPHLDGLLKIKTLTGIQVQATPAMQSTKFWIPHLKRIQESGKTMWIEARSGDEVQELMENLKPQGLFIKTWTTTEQEAKEVEQMVDRFYK